MIFGFFKKESDSDRIERERQAASIQCLERGELPLRAQERIKRFQLEGSKMFTSDLSCNEHLLVREAGYETVSQVMGSAFVNISLVGSWTVNRRTGELTDRSNALMQARHLAVSRLKQEVTGLGAHGAIGIKLEVKNYNFESRLVEVTAIGTAIKIPGRTDVIEPFTSDLSGQEFWQLYEAGYWPVALVVGASCYYAYTDPNTRTQLTNWWGRNATANQEIGLYTGAFNDCYNNAVNRLTFQAQEAKGDGIVGVNITHQFQDIEYEYNKTTHHDLLITVLANGTAIKKDAHPREARPYQPLMIMDLRNRTARDLPDIGREASPQFSSADDDDLE